MSHEEEQALVYKLAEDIMMVVAGRDMNVARTAVTLAVTAMIVVGDKDEAVRHLMLTGFEEAVRRNLLRPDVVEWIETSVVSKEQLQ
jgi:hypothetical protein